MPFVDATLAMKHCRAAAPDVDLVGVYLAGAEQAAIDYLNRPVFESQAALDAAEALGEAGENAMVVNAAILAAILLTTGHLYANREDVVVGVSAVEIPGGAKSLLRPHRIVNGV